MQKIDFEKICDRWYVVMDDYAGDHEDLEMVDGADTFLDFITMDDKSATIEILDEETQNGDCSALTMIDHDDFGGTYQVENCNLYDRTVWLCNVAHLFFNGEHPEKVFFKILY